MQLRKRRRGGVSPRFVIAQAAVLIIIVDDVMAHVHTFGTVAPEAAGIIQ